MSDLTAEQLKEAIEQLERDAAAIAEFVAPE